MMRQPGIPLPRSSRGGPSGGRWLRLLHLDGALLAAIAVTSVFGLLVLFSASGGEVGFWLRQVARLGVGVAVLLAIAQVPARFLRMASPYVYGAGLLMLVAVEIIGDVSKGAQRWLDLGVVRFQPSELMKLALPMMCAFYLHNRPLPLSMKDAAVTTVIIICPAVLIFLQPDLGTALLVAGAGFVVILLAGLPWKVIWGLVAGAVPIGYVAWQYLLHDYQRGRILTLLDPQRDPLGSGYHIIQSQIAIGSGGVFGKGWMNGSQAQLEFLPERTTDFIFAVIGEEFGLIGQAFLLGLYALLIGRALFLASQCADTYGRLLAGSIAATLFVYVFVNTGMVTGLLPVVGVPLPLISYGGTSMVTLMAGFGILLSMRFQRKLIRS
ncbi:MAG: rod shape-determining protein RodA [Steroidobacteraceae bacterium]